jgi:hypothetical protein
VRRATARGYDLGVLERDDHVVVRPDHIDILAPL